jgi:hypothetical protein
VQASRWVAHWTAGAEDRRHSGGLAGTSNTDPHRRQVHRRSTISSTIKLASNEQTGQAALIVVAPSIWLGICSRL